MKSTRILANAIWLSALLAMAQNAHAWGYFGFSELCISGKAEAKSPFQEDGRLEVNVQMDVVALCANFNNSSYGDPDQCQIGSGNSGNIAVNIPVRIDPTKEKGTVYIGCKFDEDGRLLEPDPEADDYQQQLADFEAVGCLPLPGGGHCIDMSRWDRHFEYLCQATEGCGTEEKASACAQDADCLYVADGGTTCDWYNKKYFPLGGCVASKDEIAKDEFDKPVHEHICSSSNPNKGEILNTASAKQIIVEWSLFKNSTQETLTGTDTCTWDGDIDEKSCSFATDEDGQKIKTFTCDDRTVFRVKGKTS
jgi:hypothetical protein